MVSKDVGSGVQTQDSLPLPLATEPSPWPQKRRFAHLAVINLSVPHFLQVCFLCFLYTVRSASESPALKVDEVRILRYFLLDSS